MPRSLTYGVALAAALVVQPVAALDQREGQHWRCLGAAGGPDVEYVIGRLEPVSAVLTVDVADDRLLAHLHLWEAHELGQGRQVAHMPFQANRLTCRGQIYVGEGRAVPENFENGYAAWRAAAASGRAGWFTAPVDEMFRAVTEIAANEDG